MLGVVSREVAIDYPEDPRLADYVGLSDAAMRSRFGDIAATGPGGRGEPGGRGGPGGRGESVDRMSAGGTGAEAGGLSPYGRFVAEGFLSVAALVRSPYRLRSVLVSEAKRERLGELGLLAQDVTVYVAPQAVLERTVGFPLHRGLVAVGERQAPLDPIELLAAAGGRPLLVLEALNDHENLGVVFRNAAAFGVGGVLLDPRCADPLYRRCVRVSLGHVLALPFARVPAPRWPVILDDLTRAGYASVALSPGGELTLEDCHPLRWGRVALIVGAEGPGLSAGALAAAQHRVRITLTPGVDSLNVATATGIALHWLTRPSPPPLANSYQTGLGG